MKDQKKWELNKKLWKHVCLAGVLVCCLYFCLLILCRIVPFGDNTWIMYDLKRQYVDFYSYLRTIISGENNIFYSFSTTLGSGLIGFYIYYLNNPLFFLFCLFSPEKYPLAVSIEIGITLILGGMIMEGFLCWYLENRLHKKTGYYSLLISVAWAFSGFLIAHGMNMMWTDVVILVPLVIYCLEKMLETMPGREKETLPGEEWRILDHSCFGYIILIAVLLLLNYYITFQVLFFVGIWTLLSFWIRAEKHPLLGIGRIALGTVLSICLDLGILLPTFLELFNSPKDILQLGLETTGKNLNPLDVISKMYTQAYDVVQPRFGLPQLFCGVLLLVLLGYFFGMKEISKREKIGFAVVLLFFLASFSVDMLNLIWHAGMEPSGHPYRQAPLCVFVILMCGLRALSELMDLDRKGTGLRRMLAVGILIPAVLVLLLAAVYRKGYEYSTVKMVVKNLLLIGTDGLLVCILYRVSGERLRKVLCFGLFAVLLVDLLLNATFTYPLVAMNGEKNESFSAKTHKAEEVVTKIKESDDGFYRMESLTPRQQNDSMMYDYNGVTHYSSAGMTYVRYFLQKCGFNDDGLYTHYGRDNTATMDSLLGLKYLMTEDPSLMHIEYEERSDLSGDGVAVYQNPYALSVAMETNVFDTSIISDIINPQTIESDPFSLQEDLYNRITGKENKIFLPATASYTESEEDGKRMRKYEITTAADGMLYFYSNGLLGEFQNMAVYLGDDLLSGYSNEYCYKILKLGNYKSGDTLSFTMVLDDEDSDYGEPLFVTEDIKALKYAYLAATDGAVSKEAKINRISSSHIQIEVTGERGVFTTIPYEEGWSIRLNGRTITPIRVYGALMYLPTGEDGVVDMTFVPKGFRFGLMVTILTFLLLICLYFEPGKTKWIKPLLIMAAGMVISFLIYLGNADHEIKVEVTAGHEKINVYEGRDGNYLFLPSYQNEVDERIATIAEKMNATVLRSDGLDSVFITTNSADLSAVYEDSSHQEPGKIRIYDSEGNTLYNGGLKYIKGRGNYSWDNWEKKSFTIKLNDSANFPGMIGGDSYAMIANASDATLLRNEIGRRMEDAVGLNASSSFAGQFVDLYVNGDYMGNYYLAPTITIEETRLAITDLEEQMDLLYQKAKYRSFDPYETPQVKGWNLPEEPEDITGGYLLEREFKERYFTEYGDSGSCFCTDGEEYFIVKSPEHCSKNEINYIANRMNEVEAAILSEDGVNPDTGLSYLDYIDVESFAKWYLVEEVMKNYDAGVSSTYFYKDSDQQDSKFRLTTGWDFDMSLGNYLDWMEYYEAGSGTLTKLDLATSSTNWFAHLYEQEEFYREVVEYFGDLLLPYAETLITQGIDEYYERLSSSARMDAIRWSEMYQEKGYCVGDYAKYEELKDFLSGRLEYLKGEWITE